MKHSHGMQNLTETLSGTTVLRGFCKVCQDMGWNFIGDSSVFQQASSWCWLGVSIYPKNIQHNFCIFLSSTPWVWSSFFEYPKQNKSRFKTKYGFLHYIRQPQGHLPNLHILPFATPVAFFTCLILRFAKLPQSGASNSWVHRGPPPSPGENPVERHPRALRCDPQTPHNPTRWNAEKCGMSLSFCWCFNWMVQNAHFYLSLLHHLDMSTIWEIIARWNFPPKPSRQRGIEKV